MLAHVLVLGRDDDESELICWHVAEVGHRCTRAGTFDEAAAILGRMRVDLVVASVDDSGTGEAARLMRLAEESGVPILAVADEGAEGPGILRRPLGEASLLAAVTELLEERVSL